MQVLTTAPPHSQVGQTLGTIGRWMPLWVLARDAHGNLTNGAGRELPGEGDGSDHGDHGGDGGDGVNGGDGGDGGIEVHVIGGEGRAMQVHRIAEGRYESAVVAMNACLLR